jgi:hypothetical protein
MTTFWNAVFNKSAFRAQNGMMRKAGKVSLFCVIVMALCLVPFTVATAQNGVAVVGNSPTSSPYACTSAGVNSAIAAAVAALGSNPVPGITQAVVDASNCTSMSSANYTSEIDVSTGPNNPGQRIKLILPASGTWTAGINNSSSYALKWGDGAMIYGGTGSGEGQPFTILAGSGANLYDVCGNDPANGDAPYYHAEGFSCSAVSGATIKSAILEINASADESYVGHVTASNWGATASGSTPVRVLWVHAACCSATYEDINAEGATTANTVPCVFGDLNAAIHISQISCVHPGSGMNALVIYQSSITGTGGNGIGSSYKDIYVEQDITASDTSTPYVAVTHLSGTFAAADLLDGLRAGIDVAGSTRCMVDIGVGSRVNIANLSLGDVSTCAIKDEVNAITVNGAVANSVIASYDMTPRYGVTLGALKVGSLPAAANNAGAMFQVTDSMTNTHNEGQTCAPNGSNKALAFSNGVVWKCF